MEEAKSRLWHVQEISTRKHTWQIAAHFPTALGKNDKAVDNSLGINAVLNGERTVSNWVITSSL